MDIRERVTQVGKEKDLRQSTVFSYRRLLLGAGITTTDLSRDEIESLLFSIENQNTRRATIIAVRSVFGYKIKIPKALPRKYVLPDESQLRLALMTSPHELRGLLMMYAGLRVGEACAVTKKSVNGDQLMVDRQMLELHASPAHTGSEAESVLRLATVKTSEDRIVIPFWLAELVKTIEDTAKPSSVRESLRRAGWKVGINLNPHMLRHFYATTLIARGAPLSLVKDQMRHSDIAVTLRAYSQHDASETIHRFFD